MNRRFVLLVAVSTMCVALDPAPAGATALGTSAELEPTGSRNAGPDGGLQGFNAWDVGLFTVTWAITITGPDSVHYSYTFSGLSGKETSNIVLDVSNDCESDPMCATNVAIGGSMSGVVTEFGDFAGIEGGLKIEGIDGTEGVVYEFDSNRLPVYGYVAVKNGGGPETCAAPGGSNIACSNQLLSIGDPEAIVNFVAVPNGLVPEPGTGLMLGFGLVELAISRSRRRP